MMTKSKYFYYCLVLVGWLFWMDARGAGGSIVAAGREEPLPESIRDNPGAYRAQLAMRSRSTGGK